MIDARRKIGSASLQDAIAALLLGCFLGGGLVAWLLLGNASPYNAPQAGFAKGFGLGCTFAFFMGVAVYYFVAGAGMLLRWQRRANVPTRAPPTNTPH